MFKIGDKVRITAPFGVGEDRYEENLYYAEEMDAFIGKFGVITRINDGHLRVRVNGDNGWYWIASSLEHVNTLHVGDIISGNDGFLYRLDKASVPRGRGDDHLRFQYSTMHNGKWAPEGEYADGLFTEDYKVIKKYPLRNAKGHYIKCDRYVDGKYIAPQGAAVKRPKPVVKAVAPAIIKKPAVAPIKPLPEPPKNSDIRSELAKRARVGDSSERCNYSIEFDNGKIRHQAPDACHARFRWMGGYDGDGLVDKIVNIALNIKAHHKRMDDKTQKHHERFIQYMLNDSPWAFCFVTKDVKEALEVGILMDVNQNVSHIVGAAMSLRLATEWPDVLIPFCDVLDKGYSGNVAFLCSGHLMKGKVTQWPGHASLTSSLGTKAVTQFFKEGYTRKLPPIAQDKTQTSYQVWGEISPGYGHGGCAGNDTTLSDFTKKYAVSTTKGKGFDARTEFDYEATLISMANAFTKELT